MQFDWKKWSYNILQINFRSVHKFSLFQPWNVIYDTAFMNFNLKSA